MTTGSYIQILAPGKTQNGESNDIDFFADIVVSESQEFEAQISQHPVEDGSTEGDNIYNEPITITITGLVTNSPVVVANGSAGQLIQARQNDGSTPTRGAVEIPDTNLVITSEDYVQDAFYKLAAIRNLKQTFSVITGLTVYPNMALKGMSFPRDRKTGNTLSFTLRFQELIKAGSTIAKFTNLRSGKIADRGPVVDTGPQSTTPVDDSIVLKGINGGLRATGFDSLSQPVDKLP